MRPVRVLVARIAASIRILVVSHRDGDNDLREQLESHLAMQIDENIRRGLPPDEARRQALIAAGGLTYAAEAAREQRGLPVVEQTAGDVRYAFRGFRARPTHAAAMILTLALGIGANSAMFTIVNAVVLRPLPYSEPDRIVSLSLSDDGKDIGVVDDPNYNAWRRDARSLTLAAYSGVDAVVSTVAGPEQVHGMLVTGDYFSIFRVAPLLGRSFNSEELRADGPPVALVGEQFWRRALNGGRDVLGRSIALDGKPTTVIGVIPASFSTSRLVSFWQPYRIDPALDPNITFYRFVVGRLSGGVSLDAARAELASITRRVVAARTPNPSRVDLVPSASREAVNVMTLHERRYGERRRPLLLLFAAVGVLLLIACANLANLALANAAGRQREIAVRLALGAGRSRLMRSMLCESILLSAGGAVLGLVLAFAAVRYVVHLSPDSVGNAPHIGIDATVLLFTGLVAVLTGIAFGIAPAIGAGRRSVLESLASSSPRATGSRIQRRMRGALVVTQFAMALVLLTGAGLVTRTFWNVASIDLGIRPEHLVVATIRLPEARYSRQSGSELFLRLVAGVRVLPGVASAALTDTPPLMGGMAFTHTDSLGHKSPRVTAVEVGPDYFRTIGARLLDGRAIDSTDGRAGVPVIVANSSFARQFLPGGRAAGQRVKLRGRESLVVGVVADIPQFEFEGAQSPAIYTPLAEDGLGTYGHLVVRAASKIQSMERVITDVEQEIDPALPPPEYRPMTDIVAEKVAPRRFTFVMLGAFACLAGSLASIGLYGVLAHVVAIRTRELGVRVALGADPTRVTRLVLGQGLALAGTGIVIGLAASIASVRLIRSLLYGTTVYDPWAFASATSLLVAVAAFASFLPARRASRVDPTIALRAD